ncbi:M28 family metallopeptidase [Thermaurantiacus sp.]
MRGLALVAALLLATPGAADQGERWFRHVKVLADDGMEGRLTGTPGYDRAAAYVAQQFRALGLRPGGTQGFFQPVPLKEQSIDLKASRLVLTGPRGTRAIPIGPEVFLGTRVPQLASFEAPLVFLGNGLHLPEAGHDDFAGIDLKGKIAVVLNGGPKHLSGALKAHARSAEFWPALARAGAIGAITIQNPAAMDIPWDRQMLFAETPGMRLADPALNDARQPFFTASWNPAAAEALFAASGRSFAEMLAIAETGAELPRFPLNQSLAGTVAARDRELQSPNVAAILPGTDPRVADEFVVLTAHLDHIGIDKPVNGDAIYNGAMDNAAGVATLIETARALKRRPPRRPVLFLAVTAEERGLLGSRYFASNPTVPRMIANLNMDMFLPLWPLTHVTALGAEESTLGPLFAEVARSMGLVPTPDQEPDRNLFVRSDQYSFVRVGVPALALDFAAVTPEEKARERAWLTVRYHAPADDLAQPLNPAWAVPYNRLIERLARAVADTPEPPYWNPRSFFRRFAKTMAP